MLFLFFIYLFDCKNLSWVTRGACQSFAFLIQSGTAMQLLRFLFSPQALLASKIVSYAQGFMLMKEAAKELGWKLNYGGIALMWRGGCIIRRWLKQRSCKRSLLVLCNTLWGWLFDNSTTFWVFMLTCFLIPSKHREYILSID